jgi:8-oxo-dGTP pyrophosphatase MutT (NUDIX family)
LNHWKISRQKKLLERLPWIQVFEQNVTLPNGAQIEGYLTWEVREYALTVALSAQGIALIRQYRHGNGKISYDLPGGYLDEGEKPLQAAQRELLEETGLVAKKWEHIASLILDNTRGNAKAHIFFARETEVAQPPVLDETEELSLSYLSIETILMLIRQGEIDSLPSVAGIFMVLQQIREGNKI